MQLDVPQVPKGSYQVTYSAFLEGASGTISNPTIASCNLANTNGLTAARESTTAEGHTAAFSGADVINVTASQWALFCSAQQLGVGADSWQVADYAPIRVTLTRIDKNIGGSLDAAQAPNVMHYPTPR